MQILAFDIEGNGLLPELTECWCIGLADVQTPDQVQSYSDHDDNLPSIKECLARMSEAELLVAHNGVGYDVPALKKLFGYELDRNKLYDTMVVGGLLEPERRSLALKTYGAEQGYDKGDHDEWHRYSQEMRVYMERDVLITARLYNDQQSEVAKRRAAGIIMDSAIKLEHGVQAVLARQSNHGGRFDLEAAEKLDADLRTEISFSEVDLQQQFPPRYVPAKGEWCFTQRTFKNAAVFTPKANNNAQGYTAGVPLTKVKLELFNPASRPQIASRLSQVYGWKPTEFSPAGAPQVSESSLSSLDFPPAKAMMRYLKLSKQIGMLSEGKNAWLRLVDKGRLHGYVRSCGCRTHRMSHSRPNLAQVDKDKRMRSLFIPDAGHVMVGADASGLELRLMAAYLYNVDGGAYADAVLYGNSKDGTDVHTLNQKAVGLYSRNSSKTFFYAFLYGAGDQKLGQIIIDDAKEAGKPVRGNAGLLGKKARDGLGRGIKGLKALIEHAQNVAKTKGYLTLPDGRPVKSGARTALNSLLQGAGAVLMKEAVVIFDQQLSVDQQLDGHFHYLYNVHDEVQFSVEREYADRVGQAFCDAIEQAGVKLGYKVPFSGEYDIGANWSETH